MKKKRVLILGKIPPPYMGPAIATQIILNSSLKNEFDLLHLDTRINYSLSSMGKWSVRKIIQTISIYLKLFWIIILKKPALVLIPISQSTKGFLKDAIFIFISKIFFRKIIVQLRGSNFQNWQNESSSMTRFFVRKTLQSTNGVIVLGKNLRKLFSGIFPEEKIYVVPNGADYNLKFSVKKNNPVRILYLSNLQSSKGIEDVISAIKILKEKIPGQFHLDVAGNWRSEKTKEKCLEAVKANDLPITFFPPAIDVQKLHFFSTNDIFIFTPREPEGHPWVIVEAMAAGLPIISTSQGAITESVIEGQNGYLVPVRSPEEIALKLEMLIKDSSLRENFGRTSRKFYEENFTEQKMVERLAAVFHAVMAK